MLITRRPFLLAAGSPTATRGRQKPGVRRPRCGLAAATEATGQLLVAVELRQQAVRFLLWRQWSGCPSLEVTLQGAVELDEVADESKHAVDVEAASAADG